VRRLAKVKFWVLTLDYVPSVHSELAVWDEAYEDEKEDTHTRKKRK